MKSTLPFVKSCFKRFNDAIFGGRLPEPVFEIVTTKSYNGQMCYTGGALQRPSSDPSKYLIKISDYYDLKQGALEDVVIHEMIHYFIRWNGLRDTSPHGVIFKGMMEAINSAHRRHLTVTLSPTEAAESLPEADTVKARLHVVAILTLADGRKGLKVLPRVLDRIDAFVSGALGSREVETVELYMQRHSYFERFPCSGALRYHLLADNAYREALVGARRLVRKGDSYDLGAVISKAGEV